MPTFAELEQRLHALCQEIDTVIAHADPHYQFVVLIWDHDEEGNRAMGCMASLPIEEVRKKLPQLLDPRAQIGDEQSVRRDITDNRN